MKLLTKAVFYQLSNKTDSSSQSNNALRKAPLLQKWNINNSLHYKKLTCCASHQQNYTFQKVHSTVNYQLWFCVNVRIRFVVKFLVCTQNLINLILFVEEVIKKHFLYCTWVPVSKVVGCVSLFHSLLRMLKKL
jgi:hypothetical protein